MYTHLIKLLRRSILTVGLLATSTLFGEVTPEDGCFWRTANGTLYYVDATRPDDGGNGLSWATAKRTIQAAIDWANDGDTIIVTNGIYAQIVTDNKPLIIQSVNGPDVTIIKALNSNRCASLASSFMPMENDTVLVGFTLTDGYKNVAAGVFGGTLYNCIIRNNHATDFAGGARNSVLYDCVIINNSAIGNGGVLTCILNNCVVAGNSSQYAGGASFSALTNCTIVGNNSWYQGYGGAGSCTLNSCIVWGNKRFERNGVNSGVVDDVANCEMFYTCSGNGGTANGCIQDEPLFVNVLNGDYRLRDGSPCLGIGDPTAEEPMVDRYSASLYTNGRVNMGAYGLAQALYVDAARPDDNGDGFSWRTAKRSIQAAIDVARLNDAIIVTNGTYAPIVTSNQWLTIQSVNGAEHTIIDGGAADRCATLMSDSQKTWFDSTPSAFVTWYTNTVLCGFTLTNGYLFMDAAAGVRGGTLNNCILADNEAYADDGGGACYSMLRNCTLIGNSALNGGGADQCVLSNCTLTNNLAYNNGGGASASTLRDCTLIDNRADMFGAGASGSLLNDCTLTGNETEQGGGGTHDSTLSNCLFSANSAFSGGGALWSTLTDCVFLENFAEYSGGGAFESVLSNCTLRANEGRHQGGGVERSQLDYCTLSGNFGGSGGGASESILNHCTLSDNEGWLGGGTYRGVLNNCLIVGNFGGVGGGTHDSLVTNCTLVANSAAFEGGGACFGMLNSCIVWGNGAGESGTDVAQCTLYYTCSSDGGIGNGCIQADPMFVDATNGDYRLLVSSPCAAAGDPRMKSPKIDNYGASLYTGKRINMGAFGAMNKYVLTLVGGTHDGSARHALYDTTAADIQANPPKAGYEFQYWSGAPAAGLGEEFDLCAPSTTLKMPAANVTLTAVYAKNPGTVAVAFDANPFGAASLDGLEWSIDGKVWFPAYAAIRVSSGTQSIRVRSTDGRWLVPVRTRLTIVASATDDAPQMAIIPVTFAPAFDETALAESAAEPTSSAGLFAGGQMQWTALQVGVRAKLGPLPLQANATAAGVVAGKLPSGLKLVMAEDGAYIVGIPTKAGEFNATLRAKARAVNGAYLPVNLTVDPLPAEYLGTFNGRIGLLSNNEGRNAQVTLTVSSVGKISGSSTLGGKRFTFKADGFDSRELDTGKLTVTNMLFSAAGASPEAYRIQMTLAPDEREGFGWVWLSNEEEACFLEGELVRNGSKDKALDPIRTAALASFEGYYTIALQNDRGGVGAGYLTVTINKYGAVKASGKLPDGTAVSMSSALEIYAADWIFSTLSAAPRTYKGGWICLNPQLICFDGDTVPRMYSMSLPSLWSNYAPNATVNGAFEEIELIVNGGYYSKLDNLHDLYAEMLDEVIASGNGLLNDTAVEFNARGNNFAPLADNPQNLKLNASSKTGLFSGSFKDNGSTRRVYGVLTPWSLNDEEGATAGAGFYLVPETVPFKYNRSEMFLLLDQAF